MYDIFISHSSFDKPWVRELAKRIDAEQFQGRSLRSWFDEQELSVGNHLRPELEAAIERSRYLGIVLSKAALASDWVRFEWDHWLTRDPKLDRVVPILLEDCEIPIKYRGLIRADFRKHDHFAAGFAKLLDRLRQYRGPDAREIGERAVRLLTEAEASRKGDTLLGYLAGLNIDDPASEGLVLSAFEALLDHLSKSDNAYVPTLIVAECLAALQLRSPHYARLPQSWQKRQHWTVPLVEVRANSKIAEIAPAAVDVSLLYQVAGELDGCDRLSREQRTILTHVARTIGKMRDIPQAEDLIESLSARGIASRAIAAGAIGIEPSEPGGIYYLDELEQAEKRRVERNPPSDRLVIVLLKLRNDPIPLVKEAAEQAAALIASTWGKLDLSHAQGLASPVSKLTELQATFGMMRQPFAGRLYKATQTNMRDLSAGLTVGTIVALTSRDVHDVYFYGAAGILIPEQGVLTHQCIRLHNAGVPFAMLPVAAIRELPDRVWVTVNEEAILQYRVN